MNKNLKKYQTGDMKDFVILESVLIGRQYSVQAYTEEEAIEKYERGDAKFIKEETIDCHMEEVNEGDA